MQCWQVSEFLTAHIAHELPEAERREVLAHLEVCPGCRADLAELQKPWSLLRGLPEVEPGRAVGRRLLRQIRWLMVWDAIRSLEGWRAAFVPAAVGILLSVGLSLLLPYDALVEFCRRVVGNPSLEPGAFLMAGLVYGLVPLVPATWIVARSRRGLTLVQGVEAAVLFLVLVAPYAIIQCRGFPVPGMAGFLAGITIGAFLGSIGWRWGTRPRLR